MSTFCPVFGVNSHFFLTNGFVTWIHGNSRYFLWIHDKKRELHTTLKQIKIEIVILRLHQLGAENLKHSNALTWLKARMACALPNKERCSCCYPADLILDRMPDPLWNWDIFCIRNDNLGLFYLFFYLFSTRLKN